jgi:hypothetical protein
VDPAQEAAAEPFDITIKTVFGAFTVHVRKKKSIYDESDDACNLAIDMVNAVAEQHIWGEYLLIDNIS